MASKSILIFFILFFSHFSGQVLADCVADPCIDNEKALSLKHIAFICLFMANMFGFWLRTVKGFNPDRSAFVIMKAFAGGVILATGFVHVLPNSFEMFSRSCLDPTPGRHLFVACCVLGSAIFWIMFDSFPRVCSSPDIGGSREVEAVEAGGAVPKFQQRFLELSNSASLASVCVTLAVSNHTCSIKGLITALCVHQIFQGMEYADDLNRTTDINLIEKAIMAIFLSTLTPLLIAIEMLLLPISSSYKKENSPDNIVNVGFNNALAAGQLIYVGLVGFLAAEFMGNMLQQDVPLRIKSYAAVLFGAVLGAAGMSAMALLWAN